MLFVSILPIRAKRYVSGEPWPKNGYKLTWVTPAGYYPLEVQRFTGTNLYYLKLKPIGLKNGDMSFDYEREGEHGDTLFIQIRENECKKSLKYI